MQVAIKIEAQLKFVNREAWLAGGVAFNNEVTRANDSSGWNTCPFLDYLHERVDIPGQGEPPAATRRSQLAHPALLIHAQEEEGVEVAAWTLAEKMATILKLGATN